MLKKTLFPERQKQNFINAQTATYVKGKIIIALPTKPNYFSRTREY